MSDTYTLHLNSSLTEDDWNKIRDAEFEHTERIWYSTPSGRKVAFINENVLDKIRVEIEQKAWDTQEVDGEHDNYKVVDLGDILEIFNNIGKTESEG